MDLKRTMELVQGGLFQQESTWKDYAAARHSLAETLQTLTGPIVVGSAVVAYLLRLLFQNHYLLGAPGIGSLLMGLLGGLIGIGIWAGAAYFFAGMFAGSARAEPDGDAVASESAASESAAPAPAFDQAVAAVSFGFLPAFVGAVLGTLPWIGWLLSLAAFVYALICLYRVLPLFLPVGPTDRIKHYIATLVAALVGSVVLMALLGGLFGGGAGHDAGLQDPVTGAKVRGTDGSRVGIAPGMGAALDYTEAAARDRYEPPTDGRLSRAQVEQFVRSMERTRELREEYGSSLERLSDGADQEGASPSLGDLMSGVRGVMNLTSAEMQVVKSGGGNWAEHEWIKRMLFEARIQRDLNDAVAHNYRLYQEFADRLDGLL